MALQDNRWISHILPIQTAQEIREYVILWEKVHGVTLQENNDDSIRWRWTDDGEHTTKSAYQIQFEGPFSKLRLTPIWKAGQSLDAGFLLGHSFTRRYSPPTTY